MVRTDKWTGQPIAKEVTVFRNGEYGWVFEDALDVSKPMNRMKAEIVLSFVGGKDPYTGDELMIKELGAGLVWISGWKFAPGVACYDLSHERWMAKVEGRAVNEEVAQMQEKKTATVQVGASPEERELRETDAPRVAAKAATSGGEVGLLHKENIGAGGGGLAGIKPNMEAYHEQIRQYNRRRGGRKAKVTE